jgi:hypothetical protein
MEDYIVCNRHCGGVKWSAPENSPDLAHAEHILAVRAGFGQ